MNKITLTTLAACMILALFAGSARATLLYDNGEFSGMQEGRNASGPFMIVEDFVVDSISIMTGIEWTQHDDFRIYEYTFTEFTLYVDAPVEENLIFSLTVVADRTLNDEPTIFDTLIGYDYAISGLSIELDVGNYWFGIRSEFPGGGATWDQTTGTSDTIQGRWQYDTGGNAAAFPGVFYEQENSAFQIIGETISIPEPNTLALFGFGLAGLGFTMRRRRSMQFRRPIWGGCQG